MRLQLFTAIVFVMVITGCANRNIIPAPVTDGINCIVTAQMDDETQVLQVSRSGEIFDSVFLHSDGSKGLGLTVSPSGCFLDVYKVKKQIDIELVSHSLPALVYIALNHNYIDDLYNDGVYRCTDTCGDFEVCVGEDGIISKIIYLKYNYICEFDYKTAGL